MLSPLTSDGAHDLRVTQDVEIDQDEGVSFPNELLGCAGLPAGAEPEPAEPARSEAEGSPGSTQVTPREAEMGQQLVANK